MKTTIITFILAFFFIHFAYAEGRSGKNFSLAFDVGLPQLIGLEASYIGVPFFEIGLSYGNIPVNKYIGDNVSIDAVAIDANYSVLPTTSFTLTAPSIFLRYYPNNEKFYFQITYTKWKLGTSISGNLIDSTGKTILSNALSGDVSIDLPSLDLIIGLKGFINDVFFFNIGVGIAYMLEAKHQVSIGGKFSFVQSILDPSLQDEYEAAKTLAENELKTSLDNFRQEIPLLPLAFLSFGRTF